MVMTKEAPAASAKTKETEELSILDQTVEATVAKLDKEALRYRDAIHDEAYGVMKRAIVLAKGIKALRSSLKDLMPIFMDLQGSDLGFKTDKDDKGGYPQEVVRDCLVTAFLSGVYPTGNQFNVIAGRTYITQNGWKQKLMDVPGLTDLQVICGIPALRDGQTCVRVLVNWKIKGHPQELHGTDGKPGRVFPIRVNSGMIVDAILGKAKAKGLHAAYETIRGRDFLPEMDESEAITMREETNAKSLAERLKNGVNGGTASPEAAKVEPTTTPATNKNQIDIINSVAGMKHINPDDLLALVRATGAESLATVTEAQGRRIIIELEDWGKE